ncbi:hypothetical protein KVP10_08575 [Candidimonas humi]|uniref:Uncharacterized protein n=1 Tax=Candidimonas humi TaxID=683355 RepID=A0ABV8NXK0_9BURK|nr:hypothetical protein [Candidimonas humi]MBV6304941.1 hypothetical protein [Candidimonas humi]
MATFPDYATILLDGFDKQADYGVLRTDMDGGIAKQRARYSLPIVTRNAQILVESVEDKNGFDAWVKTDLFGGAGWFDWTDPLDGVTKQARIVKGAVKWTSPGIIWLAQVQIETVG